MQLFHTLKSYDIFGLVIFFQMVWVISLAFNFPVLLPTVPPKQEFHLHFVTEMLYRDTAG